MMPAPFLLDTNAYYLFFKYPKHVSYNSFSQTLKHNNIISFYIPELTSLEIHSVLGKYRRGSPRQLQICDRKIIDNVAHKQCSKTWISHKIKKLNPKIYRDILKLITDIEAGKGDIQATILKLDSYGIAEGQQLLIKYADFYAFNSHDALIAGTLIASKKVHSLDLTLVTSDRGLKAVLREEAISCLDPLTLC